MLDAGRSTLDVWCSYSWGRSWSRPFAPENIAFRPQWLSSFSSSHRPNSWSRPNYPAAAQLHDDVDVMGVLEVIVVFDNARMIDRFQDVDFLAHLDTLLLTLESAYDLFCRSCSFWMIFIAYFVLSRSILTSWQKAKPPLPNSRPTECCL